MIRPRLARQICIEEARIAVVQDLVVPMMQPPDSIFMESPLLGNEPYNRSIYALFRGTFRESEPRYSRGIRQKLHKLAKTGDWHQKYNIRIGTQEEVIGIYTVLMSSSVFCLALPGKSHQDQHVSNKTSSPRSWALCPCMTITDNCLIKVSARLGHIITQKLWQSKKRIAQKVFPYRSTDYSYRPDLSYRPDDTRKKVCTVWRDLCNNVRVAPPLPL